MKRRWLLGGILSLAVILLIFIALKIKDSSLPARAKEVESISSSSLSNQAKDLEAKGNLLEAKSIYQRLINEFPNSSEVMGWQKKIEELNIKLLFSPSVTPKSMLYQIQPGDTISEIAKQFNTTPELIMKSNYMSDDKILPGRKIKVWNQPFSIVVDKSQNILILKTDEEIVKTYIVATGINNCTPTGTFKIADKLQNPTWFKAGAVVPADSPENILGSRWLGFDLPRYGIHGTTDPQSLGKQATQGCVRMYNSDIEELYVIIPTNTEVTIVD